MQGIHLGIRTVPAAVSATESSLAVILRGEDQKTVFEVKIAGGDFSRWTTRSHLSVESVHALRTNTGFVPMRFGNTGDEFRRNNNV